MPTSAYRTKKDKSKYIAKKKKKVEYIKKKEKKHIPKEAGKPRSGYKKLSNLQKKKVAQWEAIMSTVKKGGIGSDRVTSRYRSPSRAFEYFADKPGSRYEGLATKKLQKLRSPNDKKYFD
tara:strand:+ start:40 stop:399 length:360 start_codon:yes stop_codon:yes gene_type:complete